MRVLVTGGAGFIGSAVVRRLLETTDHQVTVFDAFTYAASPATLEDLRSDPRVDVVKGDVCDRAAVASVMAGHQAVLHLAAETHVDRSIAAPDAFVRTNCLGTEVVMDTARAHDVERLVHVSTDEVYGSVESGFATEDAPLDPRSPYAASKAGSDLLALAHHATHGLPVVVTRGTNTLGPFQFPEKVVPLFTTRLLQGRPVPLYGDGLHRRCWLPVQAHADALLVALERGAPGTVCNVGGAEELANVELAARLVELTGASPSLVEHVVDRPGHDRRYAVDSTRIEALGWVRPEGIDEALASTVEWYRTHQAWWGPLVDRARL